MMLLHHAQLLLPGATLVGNPHTPIARVHSDTRSLRPGDLFVALQGERFDAHDFIASARALGAAAVLARRGAVPTDFAGLEVDDTQQALEQLGAAWRAQYTLPLIAVTGSNGKTTVTQMTAAILRAWMPEHSLATEGNYNNHIGVPLTLLRLRASHKVAVLELGMNHPGEIARLAQLTKPTVALINNAQREHQEFMASVEAVARENATVLDHLDANGVVVFPAGDPFTALWQQLAGQSTGKRRVVTFGTSEQALWRLSTSEWRGQYWSITAQTPAGELNTRLYAAGQHNVLNALAAAASAHAAGAPLAAIAQGLEQFRPVAGRSRLLTLRWQQHDLTVVDDSYNANPDSVRAAIDVLTTLPAPQLLVLGDMGEVGAQGPAFHAEVGDYARARGISQIFTLGELAQHCQAQHFSDLDTLVQALHQQLPQLGSVLIKGSRFMRMERVLQALEAAASSPQTKNKEARHAA